MEDVVCDPVVVWFRNDLRLSDNLAINAAQQSGKPVIFLYVNETGSQLRHRGAAQGWWLHQSLTSLTVGLDALGARLILRQGESQTEVRRIMQECGASTIYWNRRYDPEAIEADSALKSQLRDNGFKVETFDGQLLHEPTRIKTGAGNPFKVYTPFWRAFMAGPEPRDPIAAPTKLTSAQNRLASDRLEDWNLVPTKPNWAIGMADEWQPGEEGASQRLETFVAGAIHGYGEDRNIPDGITTSKLSPHLALGEISPFQVWHAANQSKTAPPRDLEVFRKELVWREFAYHLLFHFPKLNSANFNASFDAFAWAQPNAGHLKAWQKGETGYPIVDAGMRELWQTGWMHNRVRMITASFLIKHLLIDWRVGETWFWDTLVDACPANNPASWQWVAGSGADAAPYYRIFNPIIQGEKFDADGAYVRKYVPELKHMPAQFIHKPWEAPLLVLKTAGVTLGKNYPNPIVDHAAARDRALDAYKSLKGAA
ncbi:MAG: cryptochrome/photolyase family protein [Rhizobiaceae bacterium]